MHLVNSYSPSVALFLSFVVLLHSSWHRLPSSSPSPCYTPPVFLCPPPVHMAHSYFFPRTLLLLLLLLASCFLFQFLWSTPPPPPVSCATVARLLMLILISHSSGVPLNPSIILPNPFSLVNAAHPILYPYTRSHAPQYPYTKYLHMYRLRHVCSWGCLHANMRVDAYVRVDAGMCADASMFGDGCMCVDACVYVCACMCVCVGVRLCVWMNVCVCG